MELSASGCDGSCRWCGRNGTSHCRWSDPSAERSPRPTGSRERAAGAVHGAVHDATGDLRPCAPTSTTDYYRVSMEPAMVEILPGLTRRRCGATTVSVPGPTFQTSKGRETVDPARSTHLPPRHPTLGYTPWTSVHLHGSASLPEYDGYASDITNPGAVQGLPLPELAERPDALVPRPRRRTTRPRTRTWAWPGCTSCIDAIEQALPIPHGEYDVPLIVSDAMFNADGQLLFDTNDGVGHLRRRDPGQRPALAGDDGRAAQVPLPDPERLGRRAPTRWSLEQRRADDGDRHGRRADAGAAGASRASATAWPSATR